MLQPCTRLAPASVRGQVILRHNSCGPELLLYRTSIQRSASPLESPSLWLPLASCVLVPWQLCHGSGGASPAHKSERVLHGQEQMSQHTEPPERKPPPLGGGDAHQEVRSSQTLLPELREEDEEEDEESVLLSLLLLFGPLRLPLLLLLLVDVSLWRCRDRLRLVVARLEGFQPRRRGDLR